MAYSLTGKYYVGYGAGWTDITTQFQGLRVLSIDGFNEVGDSVSVFTQQWLDSQAEDCFITTEDVTGDPVIIRSNVDLQMTVIISRRYANTAIDEQVVYDSLRTFLNNGDFYLYSLYNNKVAHVISIKGFKPTTQKLNRGNKSYIMVTIPLHTLDVPTDA